MSPKITFHGDEETGDRAPDVAEAVAALNAMFEGDHNLTADLSFDQVYAKALPYFITIWRHMMREQALGNPQERAPGYGDR